MMRSLPRLYDAVLADHLARRRQMLFVVGPRQVGKTTTCRLHSDVSLNWDNTDDRRLILKGPAAVAEFAGLSQARARPPAILFDEIHKHGAWTRFLKGFFDAYGERCRILVTGSSRLDVYRRGGDSLLGRYFPYRMHPFSVAEAIRQNLPEEPVRRPARIADREFDALLRHGGYPEPFATREDRFSKRWQRLRLEQILKGDVRDLTRIQELAQVEALGLILADRSSSPLVYSNLAQEIQVSVDTIRRWVRVLSSLHVGFLVRPWSKSVSKSLRKEPKWFLHDWSGIHDPGARTETFVACHLLKAVQGWTDLGFGDFELFYLRDKAGREVDFLVVRDRKPWFLVEAKAADTRLSPALGHFQGQVGAAHAFQCVLDLEHAPIDPFAHRVPVVVPARTLLSQFL